MGTEGGGACVSGRARAEETIDRAQADKSSPQLASGGKFRLRLKIPTLA
jgi:hypothetical protein